MVKCKKFEVSKAVLKWIVWYCCNEVGRKVDVTRYNRRNQIIVYTWPTHRNSPSFKESSDDYPGYINIKPMHTQFPSLENIIITMLWTIVELSAVTRDEEWSLREWEEVAIIRLRRWSRTIVMSYYSPALSGPHLLLMMPKLELFSHKSRQSGNSLKAMRHLNLNNSMNDNCCQHWLLFLQSQCCSEESLSFKYSPLMTAGLGINHQY